MVIIKQQISLPKNCSQCPMCDLDYGAHGGARPWCKLLYAQTKDWDKATVRTGLPQRSPNCPLQDGGEYTI